MSTDILIQEYNIVKERAAAQRASLRGAVKKQRSVLKQTYTASKQLLSDREAEIDAEYEATIKRKWDELLERGVLRDMGDVEFVA